MTNTNPSDRDSSPSKKLGFDEFIAIFVAFTTIGAILWWSISRQTNGWQFNQLQSSTTPTPSVSPKSNISDLQAALFPTPTATTTPTNGGKNSTDSTGIAAGITGITAGLPSIIGFKDKNTNNQDTSPSTLDIPQIDSSNIVPVPLPESSPSPETTKKPELTAKTPTNKKSIIPPPIDFPDIPPNFWGDRFIKILSQRRMLGGFEDYTFRPNQPVNRAQFAAMLNKAVDKQVPDKALNFKDVSDDFWAKSAIQKGISTGFLRGYPDEEFKPDRQIPRVEVLVALASGLNLPIPDNPESVISIYKDAKDIPKYAIGKIAAATMNQLVVVQSPEQQLLSPNDKATRGEVAAMIHQTLVRMKKLDPIDSPNIVRPKTKS